MAIRIRDDSLVVRKFIATLGFSFRFLRLVIINSYTSFGVVMTGNIWKSACFNISSSCI